MGRLLAREIENPSLFCSNTHVAIADNLRTLVDTMTFMAWVKPRAGSGSILETASGNAFGLRYNSSKQIVFYYNGNGLGGSSATALDLNKWAFVVFSYNRITGNWNFYKNGVLASAGSSVLTQAAPTTIYRAGGGANPFSGLLAEPAIFNRVLTDEEILRIYEQGTSAYPQDGSCVLDYRFDNGGENGQTITDYSGKGNNGTLTIGSGYLWKEGPVPMRVCIPQGKPLVSIEANNNTTNLSVADATLAAAFGVSAGQVGVNGISVGAWIKKKKHVTDYQGFANKGIYGASGYGAYIEGSTNLHTINAIILLPSSGSVVAPAQTTKALKRFTHAVAVNGLTYGSIYIDGKLCKKAACTAVGNGTQTFALITSAGTGNINNSTMHFLANRPVTSSEVINMYKYSIFPPDVLYWHGPDETGTKVACYWGTGVRVPSCDASLVTGTSFSNDSPWNAG